MDRQVATQIRSLEKGDLVKVSWFDANDCRGNLAELKPETLVDEWGVYLGIRGSPKHILLGKYYVRLDHKWEATCIPVSLIQNAELVAKRTQRNLRCYRVLPCRRNVVSVRTLD